MSDDVYLIAKNQVIEFLLKNTSLTRQTIVDTIKDITTCVRNRDVINTPSQCIAKTGHGSQCTFRRKEDADYCMKHNNQFLNNKLKYGSVNDIVEKSLQPTKTITLTEIIIKKKMYLVDELTSRVFTNDGEYVYLGLHNNGIIM